jgi:hypothetical protein
MNKYKYLAWKCLSNCDPILNTERLFVAQNKKSVLDYLAYEEYKEDYKENHNRLNVACKDGTKWHVSYLGKHT